MESNDCDWMRTVCVCLSSHLFVSELESVFLVSSYVFVLVDFFLLMEKKSIKFENNYLLYSFMDLLNLKNEHFKDTERFRDYNEFFCQFYICLF